MAKSDSGRYCGEEAHRSTHRAQRVAGTRRIFARSGGAKCLCRQRIVGTHHAYTCRSGLLCVWRGRGQAGPVKPPPRRRSPPGILTSNRLAALLESRRVKPDAHPSPYPPYHRASSRSPSLRHTHSQTHDVAHCVAPLCRFAGAQANQPCVHINDTQAKESTRTSLHFIATHPSIRPLARTVR